MEMGEQCGESWLAPDTPNAERVRPEYSAHRAQVRRRNPMGQVSRCAECGCDVGARDCAESQALHIDSLDLRVVRSPPDWLEYSNEQSSCTTSGSQGLLVQYLWWLVPTATTGC